MFQLPETAPWWAVLVVVVFVGLLFGMVRFMRAVWPQNSRDRKELLQGWQEERARKRNEITTKDKNES